MAVVCSQYIFFLVSGPPSHSSRLFGWLLRFCKTKSFGVLLLLVYSISFILYSAAAVVRKPHNQRGDQVIRKIRESRDSIIFVSFKLSQVYYDATRQQWHSVQPPAAAQPGQPSLLYCSERYRWKIISYLIALIKFNSI